jgi:hypothetical protein
MDNKTGWAVIAASFALSVAIIAAWFHFRMPPPPVGAVTSAIESPRVADTPKEDIKPPKVAVYTQPAKKELGLPADVQADPHKHVLDAEVVKPDDHPTTVVTVIDDLTGKVETTVRREPLPWLAAEFRREVRIDYGMKRGGVKVERLSFRADLLQMKSVHAGINANLDSDGDYFVGGGLGYRF